MSKHVPSQTKKVKPNTDLKLDQLPLAPLVEIFKNLSAPDIVLGITPLSKSLNSVAKAGSLWVYKLEQDFPNYPDSEILKDDHGRPDYFETYKRAYFTNTEVLLNHIKSNNGRALNQAISYLRQHGLFETICNMKVYDTATNQVLILNDHLANYKYTKEKIAKVITNADIKIEISLINAVRYGDLAEVTTLLDKKVQVDSVDKYNRSALHYAVVKANDDQKFLPIVKALLEHQANPNLSDGFKTPLGLANGEVKSFITDFISQTSRRQRIDQAADYFAKAMAALKNDDSDSSRAAMYKKPGDTANYYFELASETNELTLIGCVKDQFETLNKKGDQRTAQQLAKQPVITGLDDEAIKKWVNKYSNNKVGRMFKQGVRMVKHGGSVLKDEVSNLGHRIHTRNPR